MNGIVIQLDRDSVCAGDDVASHVQPLQVDADATIGALLGTIRRMRYLARIEGGRATWLIDTAGPGKGCIGVVAQQWHDARLTLPATTPLAGLLPDPPRLYFRYWCQADPALVFDAVASGLPLPGRHAGG